MEIQAAKPSFDFILPRYFGAKSWSVIGLGLRLITGYVFYDMLHNKKTFKEACFGKAVQVEHLSQERAKSFLPYLAAASYIHAGKDHWIKGLLHEVAPPNPNDLHLQGIHSTAKFLFDESLGLKIGLLETDDNRVLITFGAHESFNELLTEDKEKKSALRSQRSAIVANYAGLVPEIFTKAYELVLDVVNHPSMKDKKIELVGQSFGGSLASYVALKSGLDAVCINPMPLGGGLQTNIGVKALEENAQHVRNFTIETDYVTDNHYIEPLDRIATHVLGLKTPSNFGPRYTIPTAYKTRKETHSLGLGSLMKYLGYDIKTKPSEMSQEDIPKKGHMSG